MRQLTVLVFLLVTACQTNSVTIERNDAVAVKVDTANFVLNSDATYRSLAEIENKNPPGCEVYLISAFTSSMELLPGVDYSAVTDTGSTSLVRNHSAWTTQSEGLHRSALIARLTKDEKLANKVIDQMVAYSEIEMLMDTIDPYIAHNQKCWKSAGSSCPFFRPETASHFINAAIQSAIMLREWLEKEPAKKKIIDAWLDDGFIYVKGVADLMGTGPNGGFNEYANGKSGVLFYAIYKNDPDLFLDYAKRGIADINSKLDDEGLIFNNSFRGSRAVFYHSLGVDAMFTFGEILETQGINFFNHPQLKDRLKQSYAAALKSDEDYKWLEAKGTKGYNFITDDERSRRSFNSDSTAMQYIGSWRYPDLGATSIISERFDDSNGLLPTCMFPDRVEKMRQ